MDAAGKLPLIAYPTYQLKDLAAALSLVDYVICSDGGAMHIAAALGKPLLCFFGDSDATRWHPWGVPYRLLQPDSRDAADISLAAALQAFRELQQPM
jgi:ADP-heptose:LPS heptosyltransferase